MTDPDPYACQTCGLRQSTLGQAGRCGLKRAPTGAEACWIRDRSASSPTFWPSEVPGGVPGVTDKSEMGPIGAGTPHARMEWFWGRMDKHRKVVGELTGYNPLRSDYPFESAIADAFDRLVEEKEK